jgi:hypothetical protein
MAWDNAVVTNQGITLLQQVLEGGQLYLDGAAGGSQAVPPASLMAQAALANQKQTFPIVSATNVDNGKKVNIQIVSRDLTAGYTLRQVGLWARVDSGTPVLFAILQDNTGIPIPSEAELPDFAMNFYAVIDFSNEAEFHVIIDPSALVTMGTIEEVITVAVDGLKADLDAHDTDTKAHQNRFETKADLINGKVPVAQLPPMDYDPSGSAASMQNQQ